MKIIEFSSSEVSKIKDKTDFKQMLKNKLLENNKLCERCNKIKEDVRYEGLTESNICDSCLNELKVNGEVDSFSEEHLRK